MTDFEIHYLSDKPQFIEACAAWAYERWGVQKIDSSLNRALERFNAGAQKEKLPLTFVAIEKNKDLPVGMGSLWENDGNRWQEKTPWIASIFTHYRYRGHGIARSIIQKLEIVAQELGYKEIYLKSGSAADYYPQLGYKVVETVKTDETAAGQETLFKKSF